MSQYIQISACSDPDLYAGFLDDVSGARRGKSEVTFSRQKVHAFAVRDDGAIVALVETERLGVDNAPVLEPVENGDAFLGIGPYACEWQVFAERRAKHLSLARPKKPVARIAR